MNANQLAKQLRELSSQIALLAREAEMMDTARPYLPTWAQEKIDARICLACGKPIDLTEKASRGLHKNCYRKLKDQINDGVISEFDAISQGMIDHANITGRPKSQDTLAIQGRVQEAVDRKEEKPAPKKKSSK